MALLVLGSCGIDIAPVGDADDAKFDQPRVTPTEAVKPSQDLAGSGPASHPNAPTPDKPTDNIPLHNTPTHNTPLHNTPFPNATATAAVPVTHPVIPTSSTRGAGATRTTMPTGIPTATAIPAPTRIATPTAVPTPPATVPVISAEVIRVTVGVPSNHSIVTDPDGFITELRIIDGPRGVSPSGADSVRINLADAGNFQLTVRAQDSQGLATTGTLTIQARYRRRGEALVAMGDSVASGHGLELVDYLELDPCWRAPNAYPVRVFERLRDLGILGGGDPHQAEFALVACSGHDVDDLFERPVTGGFASVATSSAVAPSTGVSGAEGEKATFTQLEWVIRSNPRFVTLTVGANDTGFVGPRRLFLDDGKTLDRPQVSRRMAVIREDLFTVLNRLVEQTDSTIFVTNYYNPTSRRPQGFSTCRLDCFLVAANEVVEAMNQQIADVVSELATERVVLVDVANSFVGKEAPNGIGPDSLREVGFGELGALLAGQVEGVHPYCTRGESNSTSWINPIDCVHPNDAGTEILAHLMTTAIISHLDQN